MLIYVSTLLFPETLLSTGTSPRNVVVEERALSLQVDNDSHLNKRQNYWAE